MNWLKIIFQAASWATLAVETVIGEQVAGATKQQMALDLTDQALADVVPGLGAGNAAFATAAGAVTKLAINQAVTIHKATGAYQKATAIASAAQQDAGVAAAVTALVQSVQTTQPVTAP